MTHQEVEFRYKDHREQRVRSLRLQASELVQRLLQHVPVKGFHTVRCYGLYSSNYKGPEEGCMLQPPTLSENDYSIGLKAEDLLEFCGTCGTVMRHSYIKWPFRKKEISLLKNVPRSHVQQGDETDIATAGFINSS